MFTVNNLPSHGTLRVYVTCDRVTEESASDGMAAESGWVRDIGARDIYDSRNDVRPTLELYADHGNLSEYRAHDTLPAGYTPEDERADAISSLNALIDELSPDSGSDGSTIYGAGAVHDDETDDYYTYAIHAHVKHYDGARGWIESDVDILTR